MPRKKITSISLPVELAEQVEDFIKEARLGYVGISEYTREALRIKLLLDKGRIKIK